MILVDVSLSTDSWINNRRILDIEKETLVALATELPRAGILSRFMPLLPASAIL